MNSCLFSFIKPQSFIAFFSLFVNFLFCSTGQLLAQQLLEHDFKVENIPLPVELLYFEAHVLTDGVFIRFGTATEVGNFGFDIERADSNKNFNKIGFVPGSGNSNSPKHYTFKDSSFLSNTIYYYRLKQIDFNGDFKYSDTLKVNYGTSSVKESSYENKKLDLQQNFPNPFNSKTNIKFTLSTSDVVTIKIYDILGNIIKTPFSQFLAAGEYNLIFNASNFSSGNYILSVSQNNLTKKIKITLLK
ncbi:MAG: T9SS type A sorting domain-containing protein [Ignavibacteria bacterium]|nr:T9SS type A sorting domain-containing protein [Ignavibacteria bacterium]